MGMPWFKFYGADYLSDPKMMGLTPMERACWLTLLCLASVADDGGSVKYVSETRLLVMSGDTSETFGDAEIFKKFEKLGMVRLSSDGTVTVLNWKKRQKRHLTGAERTKKWREKQYSDTKVTLEGHESDARLDKIRLDKIRNTSDARASRVKKKAMKKNKMGSYREDKDSESYEDVVDLDTGSMVEEPKKPKSQSAVVFKMFPNYTIAWLKMKPQREAADALVQERGLEQVRNALNFYKEHKDEKFCPHILSPYDLAAKWSKLIKFKKDTES